VVRVHQGGHTISGVAQRAGRAQGAFLLSRRSYAVGRRIETCLPNSVTSRDGSQAGLRSLPFPGSTPGRGAKRRRSSTLDERLPSKQRVAGSIPAAGPKRTSTPEPELKGYRES
jgi:hypothetical protein